MTKLELVAKFAMWLDSRDLEDTEYKIHRETFQVTWKEKK